MKDLPNKQKQGPSDKKKRGDGNGDEPQAAADNPAEPTDSGYPEGVHPIAGTVEDELKEDMI